jgi:hypothetical protein
MNRPYTSLVSPRDVTHLDLPTDLARFYDEHEGVGLGCSPQQPVRLCRLQEVARIGWKDLHGIGIIDIPAWAQFAAYRIGISSFFDEIVYVLNAPTCPNGSILTVGSDVAGPGGSGPTNALLEPSLVLASNFDEWMKRLENMNWVEHGLTPGGLTELPKSEQRKHRRYYKTLNPNINWG